MTLLDKNKILLFSFVFLLGFISSFSLPPYNLFFINFISLPLLFFTIIYVKKKSKSVYRKKPFLKNLFILGTSFGFGFFFCGIYWITHSLTFDENFKILIPISLIIIPLFLSLFFSIPIMIAGNYLQNDISSIFLISFLFAISDFLRNNILSGFPWNLWSYSFSWSIESLQILSTIGFFTFNLLIITFFFIPSVIFFQNKIKYFFVAGSIILIFSNYFYGSYLINSKKLNVEQKKINFKIISAGMNLSDFQDELETASKLIKYSEPDKKKKTIFVWPEGVFLNPNYEQRDDIKKLFKKNFSKNHIIIFGANSIKKIDKDNKYFNSMIFADNNLNFISQYNKKKLVPFGEFLPFEKFLNLIGLKKITLGHSSFSEGTGKSSIDLKFDSLDINILPLICYEIIFPNLVDTNNKFNLIINISEDAWFGKSIGPYQHSAKAVFRAIESRVYIIRAANMGVSAFITSEGKILKNLQPNEIGNIELNLPLLEKNKQQYKKDLIFLLLLITYIFTFFILRKFKI